MKTTSKYPWYRAMALVGLTTVVIAGCAGVAPTAQFTVSEAAIADAVRAGAPEHAPLELKTARDKFSAANQALAANDNKRALLLAEQVEVDAKLAEMRARAVKAQMAAAASNEGTRVLRQELNR